MPLWSATLENFAPNKLYFKVRPLVDNVCTTDAYVATWLGILGFLTGDLTVKDLTLDKVLCALYLRNLPLQIDTSIPSPLSCQMFGTPICLASSSPRMTCGLLSSSTMIPLSNEASLLKRLLLVSLLVNLAIHASS